MIYLQAPIPKLPVPDLHSTLQKYLQSMKAVISEAQYKHTREYVDEFGKPGGVGERLQEMLKEYALTSECWVSWYTVNLNSLIKIYFKAGWSLRMNNILF